VTISFSRKTVFRWLVGWLVGSLVSHQMIHRDRNKKNPGNF